MQGLVLEGVRRVVHRADLPDPAIVAPTDAIVAVRRAGLCGSDLHPYEGREAARFGVVCGHEIVGEVVAIGGEVTATSVGDRVLAAFTTSCGACGPCRRGLTARCVRGELFGFGPADDPTAPALHGGQAQFVRIPLADTTLVAVPDVVGDTAAVLLTDNLPTAWRAVERAEPPSGGTVVVVGLGAVGLCAVAAARRLDAGAVLAVDPVMARRDAAERLGARAVPPDAAVAALDEMTGGDRAPSAVEAAGTPAAQDLAVSLLRAGGALSVIAVQTAATFGFSPVDAYDTNLTVRFGRASVRATLDRVLPQATALATAVADVVLTDPLVALADGPQTYARFARRDAGMVKAVFAP